MFEALNWDNLLSGTIGAILGAVLGGGVTVLVLFLTNRVTRQENAKALSLQKGHFETAASQADAHFKAQLSADREAAREAREISAVEALLTFLQTDFYDNPTDLHLLPKLAARCNLLTLNARREVSEGWDTVRFNRMNSGRRRHPLEKAIVPWVSAINLARRFPNVAPLLDGATAVFPVISIADVEDSDREIRRAAEALSRRLLQWAHLSDEEKVNAFDEITHSAALPTKMVRRAVDYLLGAQNHRERPTSLLLNRRDLVELYKTALELESGMDGHCFDAVKSRAPLFVRASAIEPTSEAVRGIELVETEGNTLVVLHETANHEDRVERPEYDEESEVRTRRMQERRREERNSFREWKKAQGRVQGAPG
ncbi:hypothetical protein WJX64_02960 [Leifsonia sp. YIM 134122]|uniref:Uncharacterized protein n=1 Tax=Leifsonia stereocauli TaxID=3134136 RepID=A0ABU9W0I5_9MICO